jgi:hypothetical protein
MRKNGVGRTKPAPMRRAWKVSVDMVDGFEGWLGVSCRRVVLARGCLPLREIDLGGVGVDAGGISAGF